MRCSNKTVCSQHESLEKTAMSSEIKVDAVRMTMSDEDFDEAC